MHYIYHVIAQIMNILRNEDANFGRIYNSYKAAGCHGNYAANNPRPRTNALQPGLFPHYHASDESRIYKRGGGA